MTPLYNGNEYYKKMLELQERLRKSEEERIRLEERFSLLEHESRSRHETCINRLRMRYIDFLEEQQARDERNHQLLGALDRVDSSLAMMSAKTDRLGALRKQYESSILAPYENRRPNSSLTGDSGVASQNDERLRRCDSSLRGDNGNETSLPHRVATINRQQHQGRGSHRSCESPSQVRSGSSSLYAKPWSGIRCEGSQLHQPSLAFSRFTQGGTSILTPRNDEFSARLHDNGHANPRSFLATKNSAIVRHAPTETFHYGNIIAPRVSSAHDLRNANDSFACPNADRPLRQNRQAFLPAATSKYGGSVPKYLDDASARVENSYGRVRESSPMNRPEPRRNSIFTPVQGGRNEENRAITSRSPKLSAILREELGDGEEEDREEDEDDYIGGIVENQLERYISKIRSLHRDAEPRSIDDIDHEENNTSGDLLNVTLSDDALDLPIEEKQPRDDLFPRELGNVLALAKDLADRTAASATNVANNICQDVSAGQYVSVDERLDESKPPVIVIGACCEESCDNGGSSTAHQLASIDGLHDQTNLSNYEKLESPAKNGISVVVAKTAAELASRPAKNIQDIAKSARSPGTQNENGEIVSVRNPPNVDCEDTRISGHVTELAEKRDDFAKAFSNFSRPDNSSRGLVSGEQRENDENLDDAIEDLEPWNLSALERRVQEIILNDEAQNDIVGRRISRNVSHSSTKPNQFEDDVTEVGDESSVSRVDELQTGDCVNDNEEMTGIDAPRDNSAMRFVNERDMTDESRRESSKQNEGDSCPQINAIGLLSAAEALTPQKDLQASRQQENIQDTNQAAANEADPGIEYGQEQADYASGKTESYVHQGEYFGDPNVQYEYNAQGRYDPNEGYNLNENSQYDGYQAEPYEYAEGHYEQAHDQHDYVQDPHDQQEYTQGPQEYVQDHSQLEYLQNPEQQYEAAPINEQYNINPADQRYEADPINEQYSADPNDPRYEADPINEQYSADPNDPRYETDHINEQYSGDPADQRYEADPINEQYTADPADPQYEANPNDQYTNHPNQPYVANPNQSYSVDPNQRYTLDGDRRYPEGTCDQDSADINEPGNTDQLYAIDEQYSEKPDQRYLNDPGQEYSAQVGPNQQYLAEADYAQSEIQEHSSATTEYPYPAAQEYANSELQGQEDSNVVRETEEHVQKSLELVNPTKANVSPKEDSKARKSKDVIKSILDSDTESTIERNASNTESDFDFN